MQIDQQMFIAFGITPATNWNMDETALTWAIGPTHMFVPEGQARAIGSPNAKARITAVIAVNGEGTFAPLMIILKHSISSLTRPDQTAMRVCATLHKEEGFRFDVGWDLLTWSRMLTLPGKKKAQTFTAEHKCLYLKHRESGHVIASQHKAWNDTVHMAMWMDLIMLPIRQRDGKMLLWSDNCGPHKTQAIKELFEALGIHTAWLPPNMTSLLQVLDLVVNGPVKAHVRKLRAQRIVEYFSGFQAKYLEEIKKPELERVRLKFKPPNPSYQQAIRDLFALFAARGSLTSESFKIGVVKSFVETGTQPRVGTSSKSSLKETKPSK